MRHPHLTASSPLFFEGESETTFEGKLVDLVPFEDDFGIHLETPMNEEAWFRSMFWDRREPHPESDVKKYIKKMEENKRGALLGFQTKRGDPVGGLIYDHTLGPRPQS